MTDTPGEARGDEPGNREILLRRTYDAPRELVFDAWLDREHIGEWFGPEGFRTTILEMDPQPGGIWRFVLHGPDGVDYPNRIDYLEIRRPVRLVYRHRSDFEPPDVEFESTVTFVERDGRTELTLRMLFKTTAQYKIAVEKYGAIEGGHQHLQRLADYLGGR